MVSRFSVGGNQLPDWFYKAESFCQTDQLSRILFAAGVLPSYPGLAHETGTASIWRALC